MGLSGWQRKQLQIALIDAFPNKSSLEQMLSFELEKNLDEIAGGKDLQEIIFNLIKKAEVQGWIFDLIRAAYQSNPGNLKLKAIIQTEVSELSSRNRVQQILLKQVSTEVESRIDSSLHNRIYIVQDIDRNPAQVELPWEGEIKVGSKPKVRLINTEITAVYDQPEIDGRLLILGQPGVGKTTMLLKLAEELVKRAKNDSTHPIPLLFSLPSWKDENQSIKDWLVDQLKDKYGVRKDIGKGLLDNQEILPLLDGLDELAAEHQEKCVVKINEFLHPSHWTNPVVICSRIEEYERYKTLLQLNNSLELYPFNYQQIYQYLESTDNLQLWVSISYDEDLKQLAKTPLLLNIIVLSAQEISIQTWQQFKSSEERLSYLFDAYIQRMFKRYYKGKEPKQEKTQHWLGWLAQRLIEENATEFLIERVQPYWLNNKFQKIIYNLMLWGIVGALIYRLNFRLNDEQIYNPQYNQISILVYSLASGIISAVVFGLMSELVEEPLKKYCSLIYPIFLSKINLRTLCFGIIFALIFILIHFSLLANTLSYRSQINALISGIILGLSVWLFFDVIGDKVEPFENIKFSFQKISSTKILNFLIYDFFYILISNYIYWLYYKKAIDWISYNINYELIYLLIYLLIYGISGLEIENKTVPNQGIWRSVVNIVILSLVTCPFITLSILLMPGNLNYIHLSSCLTLGLFFGFLLGILRSGIPAIKHFSLRLILWSSGYIPWNYARFLDYCTNRLFLQRVGGGYRFIHELLRQHFANQFVRAQISHRTESSCDGTWGQRTD